MTIASFEYSIRARRICAKWLGQRRWRRPGAVDYYLSEAGLAAVTDAGYVILTDDELATWKANWESRTVGKVG